MTYADAFDKIKKKLAKIDTSKMKGDYAIQVTITDEEAVGTFYVSYIGGEFSVEPYDYRDNSVAIDISVDNFIKVVTGKLAVQKAVADNKIMYFGDVEAIDNIFGIVKAPARKTTTKKAADTKKEAAPKKAADTKKTAAPKKAAPEKNDAKDKPAPKAATKKATTAKSK